MEIDTDWIKGRFSEDHKAGLTYAISTLGVVEQEVIKLRYRESKSCEEIQDIFQCLPEKVKEMEMRALNRLMEPERYHYSHCKSFKTKNIRNTDWDKFLIKEE